MAEIFPIMAFVLVLLAIDLGVIHREATSSRSASRSHHGGARPPVQVAAPRHP
jgi:hypothetical protein